MVSFKFWNPFNTFHTLPQMEWSQIFSFSFSFFFCKEPISQNDAIFNSTSSLYTWLRLTRESTTSTLFSRLSGSFIRQSDQSRTLVCFYSVLSRSLTVDFYTCCWQLFVSASSVHVPTQPSEKSECPFTWMFQVVFSALCWIIIAPWTSVQKGWKVLSHHHNIHFKTWSCQSIIFDGPRYGTSRQLMVKGKIFSEYVRFSQLQKIQSYNFRTFDNTKSMRNYNT